MPTVTVTKNPRPPRKMTYTRPWLYMKQHDAIFNAFARVLVEASTKSGKSVGMLLWLLERAFQSRGDGTRNFWWIAPSYGQADDIWDRAAHGLRAGGLVDARGDPLFEANKTELSLVLPNGAKLWFKSGEKPDLLYGRDVWAAVLDEASRMREAAWTAVDSTLTATGGPARLITNVKDTLNWTAALKRRILAGDLCTCTPEQRPCTRCWGYFKLTWRDAVEGLAPLAAQGADVITLETVERFRRTHSAVDFQTLFEAEYAERGGHPFKPRYRPLSAKPAVAWGWDLAKAADYMWGVGLDEDGAVARSHRWQHVPWPEAVGRMAALTLATPAYVDSTGLGDPVLEYAQREGQRSMSVGANFEGFVFTQKSKQQIMEGLAVGFEAGQVFGVACGCESPECPHCVLRAELEAFEYDVRRTGTLYSAPAGMHDDGVCAMALAYAKLTQVRARGKAAVW